MMVIRNGQDTACFLLLLFFFFVIKKTPKKTGLLLLQVNIIVNMAAFCSLAHSDFDPPLLAHRNMQIIIRKVSK